MAEAPDNDRSPGPAHLPTRGFHRLSQPERARRDSNPPADPPGATRELLPFVPTGSSSDQQQYHPASAVHVTVAVAALVLATEVKPVLLPVTVTVILLPFADAAIT